MIRKLVGALARQKPYEIIRRSNGDIYLIRTFIIPHNRFINIYRHEFYASDDDRAHHDHPWCSLSYVLSGCYLEHRILAGGAHTSRLFRAGQFKFRSAKYSHRLELVDGQRCSTLFITGPKVRDWGFHLRDGWVHWKDYLKRYGSK